jgi:hypothetical protein
MPNQDLAINLTANEVAHEITAHVTIHGYRGWLINLAVARLLIRLACWIAGFGLIVDMEESDG